MVCKNLEVFKMECLSYSKNTYPLDRKIYGTMTKHCKIYMKYFDIGEQDIWQCEACTKQDYIQNLQIHHIYGRGKDKDVIENLMCLCVKHHSMAHASKQYISKAEFQYIHHCFLAGNRKKFIA